jgi:2'-hydroxyisoflavone reductase
MCAETGRLLRDRVGRYVYVSTIVAYKDLTKVGLVETAPLFDDAGDKQAWYEFGKASCERTLMEIYRDRYACVRPPVIAGWRQDSDTLRFWMSRIARGGPVLAPDDGDDPVQFTDAHDVGAVALSLAEQGLSGAYNFAGPRRTRSTMKSVLEAFNAATGDRAELIWVRDDFLLKQDIQAWTNLPLYRPLHRAVRKGFMQIDSSKALAAGFDFRPIAATVEDELRWFRETTPADYEFGVGKSNKGFPRARELAVLAAWRGQGPA